MSDKINTPHSTPPQNPLPASAEFLPVLTPVFHGLTWTKQANNLFCIDFQIKSLLITSIFPADSAVSETSFLAQTSSSAWMWWSPLHVPPQVAIKYWKHACLISSPFLSSPLFPSRSKEETEMAFFTWCWISTLAQWCEGGSCLVLQYRCRAPWLPCKQAQYLSCWEGRQFSVVGC